MTGARARRLLSLLHYGLSDAHEKECRLILTRTDWGNKDEAYDAATQLEEITGITRAIWTAAGNDADDAHKEFKARKHLGTHIGPTTVGRLSCREPNLIEIDPMPRAVRTGTWPEETT